MQLTQTSHRTASALKSQLHHIWRQNLPIMRDRLERLDAFAALSQHGEVTAQQHCDALNIAHKLAGSLGIFGYEAAGKLAHKLETALRSQGPVDPSTLATLSASLRSALNL